MARDFLANQNVEMRNRSKLEITFNTQLKTALLLIKFNPVSGSQIILVRRFHTANFSLRASSIYESRNKGLSIVCNVGGQFLAAFSHINLYLANLIFKV